MKPARLRPTLIKLHRWLSLGMMALWLVQALSGMICVFHWELDDATIAAPDRPLNLGAIERRVTLLAPSGSGRTVTQIWTSAGGDGRWDVTVDGHRGRTVRIDNMGNVLRVRRDGELLRDGGLIDSIDNLHQTLMAGDAGGWIIGLSGMLLLTNLALGLYAAWPRLGNWRRALDPRGARNPAARLFGWHRALGLWLVAPAMLMVSTGVLRAFSNGFEGLIGGGAPAAPIIAPDGRAIGLPAAVQAALTRQPRARLAGLIFPDTTSATWQVRLVEPGEWSRAYGKSRVFIDGRTGRIVGEYDAPRATLAQRIANGIYPLHTGEALGLPGRVAVLLIGAWLATMIVLGGSLWWLRRRFRQPRGKKSDMTLRAPFSCPGPHRMSPRWSMPIRWLGWCPTGPAGARPRRCCRLLVERDSDGRVAALFGHFAKSNPQVALLERQPDAMILAQGPGGYISPALVSNPTWGPTWNYAVARFEVEVAFVPDETHAALERLAAWVERDRPQPWTPDRMGARYAELAQHVIAFRATVREVHAAFKLGQDERPETFAEIVAGVDPALGEWMTRSVRD